MIAKISKSGTSFYGAALYNQKKVDKGEASILATQQIAGTKPKQLEALFQHFSSNVQTKKPVLHLSLSFSEKDKSKLDTAFLKQVSKEYLDKMGYGKQPYIIYKHDDTKHPHVHILSSRVDIQTTKKISDSYEGRRSKTITDQLEKKYGLVIADHQTKAHQHIVKDVQKALEKAPASIAQLNKSLSKNASEFRAKSVGRGLVYYKIGRDSAKDLGTQKRSSRTWKGSDFKANNLNMQGLKKQFEANQIDRKHIQSAVEKTLKRRSGNLSAGGVMTLTRFESALGKQQIKPVYATNDKGIYGLSYQYKDKQFKASDLGKGHSWNQIKGQFGDSNPNSLRENLSESIVQGASIEVHKHLSAEGEDDKLHFESPNPQLQEQLNALPNEQGLDLVRLHDDYQDRIYHDPLMNDRALVKGMVGDEIDDYLQRKYRFKQEQSKRNINQRRR